MENIQVATTQASSELNTHAYANQNQVVIYVASRSNEIQDVQFNLGDFWLGATLTSAIHDDGARFVAIDTGHVLLTRTGEDTA